MKRFWCSLGIALLIVAVAFVAVACGDKDGSDEEASPVTSFTIRYTDAAGAHTISVEAGMLYSIETIPTKEGYEFKGLYDAKVGGTQYVDETGAALSAFTDKKNMVLFPRFTPKAYVIALDYQGATVTGDRKFTVNYDEDLPELPNDLTMEHKRFLGWFTQPNGQGTQVADEYGSLPLTSTLNSAHFDLSKPSITLYAAFAVQVYKVTFYADEKSEEASVVYGTPIERVVPSFRKDGMVVYHWSKLQNDTQGTAIVTGAVTDDLVLYAQEWAPVLEFDAAGGAAVSPLIVPAGEAIALPTPTRNGYTFAGWYTTGGVAFSAAWMPSDSRRLVARWNAQIRFDANGGSPVELISESAGAAITLPRTEREGYVFAGWFVGSAPYSTATMPAASISLKAGWYKEVTELVTKVASSASVYGKQTSAKVANTSNGALTEDLNEKSLDGLTFDFAKDYCVADVDIRIDWHLSTKKSDKKDDLQTDKYHFEVYSDKAISDTSLLASYVFDINNQESTELVFSTNLHVGSALYVCWYCDVAPSGKTNNSTINDFYYLIHYPDVKQLLL